MALITGLLVLSFILGILVLRSSKRHKNAPPGPSWALPVVGHLFQVAMASGTPTIALSELAKKYGDIYSLKLGSLNYVILSSLETISEVLPRSEVLDRPLIGTLVDRNMNMNLGIVFSSGSFWTKKRTWVVKALREFGFGKSDAMTVSCVEEANIMMKKFKESLGPNGQFVMEVRNIFLLPMFKTLWRMMTNRCNAEDEKLLLPLLVKSQDWFDKTNFGPCPVMLVPVLKYIFPKWTGHYYQMDFYAEARKVSNKLLHEMSMTKSASPENFVQAYALEMKKDKDNFFEEDFYVTFMDLIQAGSDTINSFLEQIILYMILNPAIQEKIQREIDEVIPAGEDVSYSHAAQMPFTQATMIETHRIGRVGTNFLPHLTSEEFEYKGYTIEKGTIFLPDLRTAFNEKIFGEDPLVFRPERFLDKTTGQLNSLRRSVIGFGVGKRMCPGENAAQITTFLFFVSILRNFELSVVPNEPKPSMELVEGISSKPHPYRMIMKERKQVGV